MITLVPKIKPEGDIPQHLSCGVCGGLVDDVTTQSLTMHNDPDINYLAFFQYHKDCAPKITTQERQEREVKQLKKSNIRSVKQVTYIQGL